MDKKTNSRLMSIAEQVLNDKRWTCPLFEKDKGHTTIYGSYDGQISALGVSILMIGLRPTVSVYYQDGPVKDDAYRRGVLEVIARMLKVLNETYSFNDAETMTRYILRPDRIDSELKSLKTNVLNCTIALKQVVRTYNLDKQK